MTTSGGGLYGFSGLRAGSYTVSMTQPGTYFFPVMSVDTTVVVGEALEGIDFPGIDPGPFTSWEMVAPMAPVILCNSEPGGCAGVSSVTLAAEATSPSSLDEPPLWDLVEFYYRVPGSGDPPILIGSTSDYDYDDNGTNRFYSWQVEMVGDDSFPLGPIEVIAVGSRGGDSSTTLPNTQITVAQGSANQ